MTVLIASDDVSTKKAAFIRYLSNHGFKDTLTFSTPQEAYLAAETIRAMRLKNLKVKVGYNDIELILER